MFPPLTIFHDSDIHKEEIERIKIQLEETFSITIKETKDKPLTSRFYNYFRRQYDGQKLLNMLIDKENEKYFLWMVSKDLYVPVMNFVFGLASHEYGAIVSFHRLNSLEMKIKESIHECGHILGLTHCQNHCVMQYSSSLDEAKNKPLNLCDSCKKNINDNAKKIDKNKD